MSRLQVRLNHLAPHRGSPCQPGQERGSCAGLWSRCQPDGADGAPNEVSHKAPTPGLACKRSATTNTLAAKGRGAVNEQIIATVAIEGKTGVVQEEGKALLNLATTKALS